MTGSPDGTLVLAVVGAVLSTVALCWNIFRDIVDRRDRVDVQCYVGHLFNEVTGLSDPGLVFRVTNAGRNPVVITNIGGSISKTKRFVLKNTAKPLPITLKPGEFLQEFQPGLAILDDHPIDLWASDSLNRYWTVSRRVLKALLAEHQSRETPDSGDAH